MTLRINPGESVTMFGHGDYFYITHNHYKGRQSRFGFYTLVRSDKGYVQVVFRKLPYVQDRESFNVYNFKRVGQLWKLMQNSGYKCAPLSHKLQQREGMSDLVTLQTYDDHTVDLAQIDQNRTDVKQTKLQPVCGTFIEKQPY